ncbi:GNAT family N-acetyltransferase [Nocardioides sp. GY 10113]|uniref:GNAT family N-acetyltransferase n=1 Tax=Nocardioides sp. GY 10113 TaxID=2569761 RepID=UPI0010A89BDD|nr:GNAT family N-acetyltransferase [Nocardioides sp. GY 10113]TIC83289.1 GNAT family N-acetyltransferase [Nocardioides sp. GY 10113]
MGLGDPVRVRPGEVSDLDAVVALEDEGFGADSWSRNLVADGLGGGVPTVSYLVADRSGPDGVPDVRAYAVVSVVGDDAELQRIVTAPAQRREGLARRLLDGVRDLAKGAGATRLLLEVREDNRPALALYLGEGFVEIARRPRYYRDGATAVILERHLNPIGGDATANRMEV